MHMLAVHTAVSQPPTCWVLVGRRSTHGRAEFKLPYLHIIIAHASASVAKPGEGGQADGVSPVRVRWIRLCESVA